MTKKTYKIVRPFATFNDRIYSLTQARNIIKNNKNRTRVRMYIPTTNRKTWYYHDFTMKDIPESSLTQQLTNAGYIEYETTQKNWGTEQPFDRSK